VSRPEEIQGCWEEREAMFAYLEQLF
jgi:hypothetical protein